MKNEFIMKKNVRIIDKDNVEFDIEFEVRTNNDGNITTSFSGDYGSGCGQVLDNINPRTEAQKKLVEYWNEYHLNDMHSGTPNQEKAVNKWTDEGNTYDYTKVCEHLKAIGLYEDKDYLVEGEPYKYGTGWLYKELPTGLIEDIENLFDILQEETDKYIEEGDVVDSLNDDDINRYMEQAEEFGWKNDEAERAIAFCYNEGISLNELFTHGSVGDNTIEYFGRIYYVDTVENLESIAYDMLESEDFWQQAVAAGNTVQSKSDWLDYVVSSDGWATTLNGWDGEGYEYTINGVDYGVCRQ